MIGDGRDERRRQRAERRDELLAMLGRSSTGHRLARDLTDRQGRRAIVVSAAVLAMIVASVLFSELYLVNVAIPDDEATAAITQAGYTRVEIVYKGFRIRHSDGGSGGPSCDVVVEARAWDREGRPQDIHACFDWPGDPHPSVEAHRT